MYFSPQYIDLIGPVVYLKDNYLQLWGQKNAIPLNIPLKLEKIYNTHPMNSICTLKSQVITFFLRKTT